MVFNHYLKTKGLLKIKELKSRLSWLKNDNFLHAHSGTNHEVFLSKKHVIRFHDSKMLIREAELLKKLDHPLIPKVLWCGKSGKLYAMVENRLAGNPLNLNWKKSKKNLKIILIKNLLDFLNYFRLFHQNRKKIQKFLGISDGWRREENLCHKKERSGREAM